MLLLYKNGYAVGKYISIEKQVERTKDVYYDVLQEIDYGWHEENLVFKKPGSIVIVCGFFYCF